MYLIRGVIRAIFYSWLDLNAVEGQFRPSCGAMGPAVSGKVTWRGWASSYPKLHRQLEVHAPEFSRDLRIQYLSFILSGNIHG